MLSLLFPFLAGVNVTLQNSLNGLMNPYIGALGTSFVGFTVQLLLLTLWQLLHDRRLVSLKKVPLPYFSSGLFAAVTVGAIGFCVSRMGSAVTTCCSVAGQVIMSAVVDHFGLFGTRGARFSKEHVPGFVLILAGILVMNLTGGTAGDTSLPLLLLALGLGACAIVIRTMNYKATQAAGSAIGGGVVNSLSGAVAGGVLFLLSTGFRPEWGAFAQIPPVYYLAGAFGTGCLLCNIAAYGRQNVFYATIFTLIGQVGTGILMDITVFHTLSAGKCIGIFVVLAGVVLDKVLTAKKA